MRLPDLPAPMLAPTCHPGLPHADVCHPQRPTDQQVARNDAQRIVRVWHAAPAPRHVDGSILSEPGRSRGQVTGQVEWRGGVLGSTILNENNIARDTRQLAFSRLRTYP